MPDDYETLKALITELRDQRDAARDQVEVMRVLLAYGVDFVRTLQGMAGVKRGDLSAIDKTFTFVEEAERVLSAPATPRATTPGAPVTPGGATP